MTRKALSQSTPDAGRFRLLVEAVTDCGIYMIDPKGIVTSWNTGAERITGYKADEILGQSFAIFCEDADRDAGMPQRAL